MGCGSKRTPLKSPDGTVELAYHEVKTAADLEIASRYASNYYKGPSSAGVGSLAEWRDPKGYGGLDGLYYPSVLRMPFKKFERPVDIAISYPGQPARVWADSDFDKVFAPNEELEAVKLGKRTVFGPLRSRGRDGDPACYV